MRKETFLNVVLFMLKMLNVKKTTFYVVVVFKRNMRNVYVQKTNIKLFLYNLNAVLTLVNLTYINLRQCILFGFYVR